MKIASITETKNQLSALLDAVRQGETVIITDRDKPVARLEPMSAHSYADSGGRLVQLERNGTIRRAVAGASKRVLKQRPPRAAKGGSVLKALLAERDETR